MVVETAAGQYFVKLRGAAQGTAALVAEVLVAELADRLELPVPPRRIITFDPTLVSDDKNDELADLLQASVGDNLGFHYLPAARPYQPSDLGRVTRDFASQVLWLDWLVLNPDRSPANPNILIDGPRFWLIDHGAALPFHHDWTAVTEATPLRPPLAGLHVLAAAATDVLAWDPLLTARLTRAALTEAIAAIPDSFLRPLIPADGSAAALTRRRASYLAFLRKRLQGPHAFVDWAAAPA